MPGPDRSRRLRRARICGTRARPCRSRSPGGPGACGACLVPALLALVPDHHRLVAWAACRVCVRASVITVDKGDTPVGTVPFITEGQGGGVQALLGEEVLPL